MKTRQQMHKNLLAAIAVAIVAPLPGMAAPATKPYYLEVAPTDLKVQPSSYEKKYVKVKDYFGRLLDMKDKADRRLWRRDWAKRNKVTNKTYFAFFTQGEGEGSNMLCYIPLSNKAAIQLVQSGLAEGQPILIKGQVKEHELGERVTDPDITYFMLDEIHLNHDEIKQATQLFVSVGKNRTAIKKPGAFDLYCPKCEKPICTIRFHKLDAMFDLKFKCPNCGTGVTYRFSNE